MQYRQKESKMKFWSFICVIKLPKGQDSESSRDRHSKERKGHQRSQECYGERTRRAAVAGEGILAWSIFKLGLEACPLPYPLVWTRLLKSSFRTLKQSKVSKQHGVL